ncbi:YegS/Rv2252/BmrU family lipid kinase [Peribacillus deserti]|uniref:YegS/Rv2252/BmrU family lipid kinase n=1 Tax=Peribacillus deserti TaxID=673318 RepID=A0ABS2QDH1_9BACI|nr:diacylglycerol kinase family protein [Peribacillus deserti]MBM7691030.1 YegS/Rv2252/BmrU family lipid kinase [Peribacillus deserti]
MTKAMLIINPSSGKEKAPQYKAHAVEVLKSFHEEVVVCETQKEGDAAQFAREACLNKFDTVVSMGGDGTINESINGLAEQEFRPKFGLIPMGTVNDFARALGIPLEPAEAVNTLTSQTVRPVDIGKMNNHYFMNVLAVGAIAEATYNVTPEQKTKLGPFAYFIEGLKALIKKTPFQLTVEHDTGKWTGHAFLMLTALTNSIGGFETFAPQAKVNDGKFHIFILKDFSFPNILKIIPSLLKGELKEHEQVEYIRSSYVNVSSSEDLAVNIDGDEGERLPFNAEVLHSHLNIYVPAGK